MKQTIAIDIDDVLADNAQGFTDFSNQRWNTNLTVDDYVEHWGEMWNIDDEEVERRSAEFHASGSIGKYVHKTDAKPILEELSTRYKLVVVTSRRSVVSEETKAWLETHYSGIFSAIHFAGFFDNSFGIHMTKATICKELGADYLIDDQLKHCLASAEAGIQALLFGEYKWNQTASKLPENVTQVADWQAVERYFAERRG